MLTTTLIGRKVVQGWDGKERGTIVALWVDRGVAYIAVEKPVEHATDGRSGIDIEELNGGTILAPDDLASKVWESPHAPLGPRENGTDD